MPGQARHDEMKVGVIDPIAEIKPSCEGPRMKYDDASWHYSGDFPAELPSEAGATHIAMFVAWTVLNGLAGDYHTEDASEDLALLKSREVTPTQWFIRACDEKFTNEDLNDEGNFFATSYYGSGEVLHSTAGFYLNDYCETFPSAESLYEVEDSWASFDALCPRLSSRLEAWRRSQS